HDLPPRQGHGVLPRAAVRRQREVGVHTARRPGLRRAVTRGAGAAGEVAAVRRSITGEGSAGGVVEWGGESVSAGAVSPLCSAGEACARSGWGQGDYGGCCEGRRVESVGNDPRFSPESPFFS